MRMYPVLQDFQGNNSSYEHFPFHNSSCDYLIEHYAHKFFEDAPDIAGVEYLPVHWSAYHVSTGYGKETGRIAQMVKDIPWDRRLFTVAQYDNGTLCESYCEDRNVTVFGAGGSGDVPIPLLCEPHPVAAKEEPKFLASFVGSNNTHPVRKEMIEEFTGRSDVFIGRASGSEGVSLFRNVMQDTLFALCPRGYGKTSFRLYEAIQIGCIPVYIYDIPWMPFEDLIKWSSFAVLCHRQDIPGLYSRLKNITPEQIKAMRLNLQLARLAFTLQNTCQYVWNWMVRHA
jgi:hypothetical protein